MRVLAPGDEAAMEAFLRPRIASSMFLLGNMHAAGLIDRGERLCGTYAGAIDGGTLVGVVAHFWNGMVNPQAPDHAGALCRLAVRSSGRPVHGAMGPADQVGTIIAALEAESAASGRPLVVQKDSLDKLYQVELSALVVPEALRSGRVVGRRAVEGDIGVLAGWRVAFSIEALGSEPSAELCATSRKGVTRAIAEGRLWVLEAGGGPVAMTAFSTSTADAVQVGGVYTPPELRGRGYARCAVAASLLEEREAGAELGVLFTAEDNLAAQRAYEALGFEHIGDWRLMLLREPWTV